MYRTLGFASNAGKRAELFQTSMGYTLYAINVRNTGLYLGQLSVLMGCLTGDRAL